MRTVKLIFSLILLLLPLNLFAADKNEYGDCFGEPEDNGINFKIKDLNTGWSFYVEPDKKQAWLYMQDAKNGKGEDTLKYDTLRIPNTYSFKGKVYGKDYVTVVDYRKVLRVM